MRTVVLMGTLALMAACAEQPAYQEPAPTGGSSVGGAGYTATPDPCNRSDYPAGAAGDTAYTNCVIQS